MLPTPTLQALAFQARDRLGDKSSRSGRNRPSCFDVVVDAYIATGRDAPIQQIEERARTELLGHLQSKHGFAFRQVAAVGPFVDRACQFLRVQYRSASALARDRSLLCDLFVAHLAEAEMAAGSTRADAESGHHITFRDYMRTQPGEYVVAETRTPINESNLAPEIASMEVEEYLVGDDGNGRRTLHLHALNSHVHILTHVTQASQVGRF